MNRKPERLPTDIPITEEDQKKFNKTKARWDKVRKKQGCPNLVGAIIKKFFGL